jgi:hypothetical protein
MSLGRWQSIVPPRERDDSDGEPDEPAKDENGNLVHRAAIARLVIDPNKASAPGFC